MSLARPLAAAAVLFAASAAGAQTPASAPALPYIQSVAIDPLAIPFGLFSAEYEAALASPGFTIGVGGTYYSSDDQRDAWAEVKGLYYPGENAFKGFSVGLTAGIYSTRRDPSCGLFGSCTGEKKTGTAPTLGVIANYDWLLGRAQRFRVGMGAGAKRVLPQVGNNEALDQVYADGRFVIGVVF